MILLTTKEVDGKDEMVRCVFQDIETVGPDEMNDLVVTFLEESAPRIPAATGECAEDRNGTIFKIKAYDLEWDRPEEVGTVPSKRRSGRSSRRSRQSTGSRRQSASARASARGSPEQVLPSSSLRPSQRVSQAAAARLDGQRLSAQSALQRASLASASARASVASSR